MSDSKQPGVIGLGIETSCDETSVSIVRDGYEVINLQIHSQIQVHQPFTGVVPELASRNHLIKINPMIEIALTQSGLSWDDVQYMAVTNRPGLIGSLMIGVQTAKTLAWLKNIPLIGINHLAGHVHAAFLQYKSYSGPECPKEQIFPALLISGGNTALLEYQPNHSLRLLGTTRDDAAGEAFDKTAKLLHLGYPGGPIIEKVARESRFYSLWQEHSTPKDMAKWQAQLPIPPILRDTPEHDLSFSFSGIKTAVYHILQKSPKFIQELSKLSLETIDLLDAKTIELFTSPNFTAGESKMSMADLAFALQFRIAEVLARNTSRYLRSQNRQKQQKSMMPFFVLSGGVAANSFIRQMVEQAVQQYGLQLMVPPPILCTDNAAMIAGAGYPLYMKNQFSDMYLESYSRPEWAS